jgi:hypothetical protein
MYDPGFKILPNAYLIFGLNSLGKVENAREIAKYMSSRWNKLGKLILPDAFSSIPDTNSEDRWLKEIVLNLENQFIAVTALNKVDFKEDAIGVYESASDYMSHHLWYLPHPNVNAYLWKTIAMSSMGYDSDCYNGAKLNMKEVLRNDQYFNREMHLFTSNKGDISPSLELQCIGAQALISAGMQKEAVEVISAVLKNYYDPIYGLFGAIDSSANEGFNKIDISANASFIFNLQCLRNPSSLGIYLPEKGVPNMQKVDLKVNMNTNI